MKVKSLKLNAWASRIFCIENALLNAIFSSFINAKWYLRLYEFDIDKKTSSSSLSWIISELLPISSIIRGFCSGNRHSGLLLVKENSKGIGVGLSFFYIEVSVFLPLAEFFLFLVDDVQNFVHDGWGLLVVVGSLNENGGVAQGLASDHDGLDAAGDWSQGNSHLTQFQRIFQFQREEA